MYMRAVAPFKWRTANAVSGSEWTVERVYGLELGLVVLTRGGVMAVCVLKTAELLLFSLSTSLEFYSVFV